MDPIEIIRRFYSPGSMLHDTLVRHSRQVAAKSIDIAQKNPGLSLDLVFLENAAMLHDIGIFLTRAESIGCTGKEPYIRHGILGRRILDDLGLPPEYGRVCERHTGAGITKENIRENNLPLPSRDMVPESDEEKIICMADKFFSKSPNRTDQAMTPKAIIRDLEQIHPEHARRFADWTKEIHI